MASLPLARFFTGKRAGTVGYVLFAALAFVVSLYWTFPEQVVAARLEQEAAKASRGEVTLRVAGGAQLWRLSGLHARHVTLQARGKAPIKFDSVRFRLRLMPLLLLRRSLYAQVQLEGGTVDVTYTQRGKQNDLRVELDAVSLGKPAGLADYVGLPLGGSLSGAVDFAGSENWSHAGGRIELRAAQLAFGPGEVKGLKLPQLPFGDVTLQADVRDGALQVKELRQEGGKLKLSAGGKVTLASDLGRSALDVCLRVGADKDFLQANPKLSAAFQLAQTQIKRDADGLLNVPLQGMLSAPEVRNGLCPRR